MKAIVIHAARDLRIDEREPETPGPGEVEIRLAAGGICGSDLHYYNHGGFGTVRVKEPMILGHEVSGHIAALGEGVSGLAIGDLVAISPSRPCGHCEYCLKGLPNHCFNMRFYGSAMPFPHIQGAFRERLVAQASQCVKADGLSAGEAAMAEPLAVTLHATRRASEILGKRVLVTGCGPIGTLSILSARRAGAAEIIAVDISGPALEFARKAGADRTINLSQNAEGLAEFSQNKGSFDILYECSGAASALVAGIHALRPRGIIVQLGVGGDMNLPINTITAKELDLRGSFRFHEEFALAVKLMQDGLIDVKPLITQTLPLADALRAFDIASDKTQSMKTQITFN
ncbi:L-idonate 5-dehydrogenase [Ochrobactrum sp. Kaboul]|nr:L-idonate 5-dehydrogenase [Ochrobactrum sp. Kaboul]